LRRELNYPMKIGAGIPTRQNLIYLEMIHIKKAEFADASVISFLGKHTFRETFGYLFSEKELDTYLDNTFSLRKLETSLLKPSNIFGILYYFGNPVAYYKVKINSDYEDSILTNRAQLQKIYILKDYLGKKLGNPLLENIFSLEEIAIGELIWLVVLQTDRRAIAFYENHGFKKLKKYYHTIGQYNLEYDLMTKPKSPKSKVVSLE
jgi:ribosomal protein S18 acetylase RimI-like enzyme